ncbi:SMI1/KNR4 family protein [Peribacillus sp. SCS-155]|uniref:SMI1/KNR4 family protein n=1 Tax=Peribacillus sedimenti TaxID=3115297 RepID=UPI003906081B
MDLQLWEEHIDDNLKGELNEETLQKVERQLQVDLPESYINLMKKRNGFYLTKKYYPTTIPNSWGKNSVYVNELYGIDEDSGLIDTLYLRSEWGIRSKKLVIISAEPPTFICLDYRRRKNPSVIFIDVEANQEIKLAKTFGEFLKGLVEEINEDEIDPSEDSLLTTQQTEQYYANIDDIILKGKPADIDRYFVKILSTNNELIRYMVEKMRRHEKPKVQYYLMTFLMECAEGNNKGIIEKEYLFEVLNEISNSKNKDATDFAIYSLKEFNKRFRI